MTERVLLIGGGGHGLVVGETALALSDRFELVGVIDPEASSVVARRLGVPHLGGDSVVAEYPDASLLLGVGAVGGVGIRPALVARHGAKRRWPSIVHPRAHVSPSAELGDGAVVLPHAVVHAGARVGAFAVVNTGAIVEHDVELGQHSMVGPGAVIGGGALLGEAVSVGLGACVRDNIRVGANAVLAMGAVVVRDVAPGVRSFGVRSHGSETRGDS